MGKIRTVVYSRVSTDKEEQQSSIESQRDYYTKYAKEQGYELVNEYYDEGLSATSSNRKAFLEMLYDAGLDAEVDGQLVNFKTSKREPLFDWIIVKDASRFARNVNAIDIVRALDDKDVHVEFESFGFTTKDSDWQFRLSLFLTFAQEESLNTSKKMKDAYLKRAQKGKFHMSVNLLGYARDKETKEYYIVKEQAEIVRKIFDYYTEDNRGSYQISDLLNEQGDKTKQGARWNGNSVLRVLRNEKFKGQVILNRFGKTSVTGSSKRVINPKNEWIIHDDAIPKIVSVEQFDKAQEIMATRTQVTSQLKGSSKRRVRGKKSIKNVFYRKIWCGNCEADYARETTIKTRVSVKVTEYFYGCRNRRNKQRTASKKCTNRGISHDVLVRELEKIGKNLGQSNFNDSTLAHEEIALQDKIVEIDNQINQIDENKANIDKQIIDIDTQITNLFNTLSSGASDTIIKMTQNKMEELEEEKVKLEASKLNLNRLEFEQQKRVLSNKFDEIVKLSKKESYTFEELLNQIHEIRILGKGKVVVSLKTLTLQADENGADKLIHYMFER